MLVGGRRRGLKEGEDRDREGAEKKRREGTNFERFFAPSFPPFVGSTRYTRRTNKEGGRNKVSERAVRE